MSFTLEEFIAQWDQDQRAAHQSILLFQTEQTKKWTPEQRYRFALLFQHARGHFGEFIWFMGNHAPDVKQKQKILANIAEEFGGANASHEQLYARFAAKFGADIEAEMRNEEHYEPFLKEFNHGHMDWLRDHDWDGQLSAYIAYERLDNIDYADLVKLGESLNVTGEAMEFFRVHAFVRHFEMANQGELDRIWEKNPRIVQEAFVFIGKHQIKLWQDLSRALFQETYS